MTSPLVATGPILLSAANLIVELGHAKDDYVNDDGLCSAGAIARVCGLDVADWEDHTPPPRTPDELARWHAARTASLTALRTLLGHVDPDARPDEMNRRELIEAISDWNDDEDRTTAHVVTAMRVAAREEADRG
jgi:hypothetical protein